MDLREQSAAVLAFDVGGANIKAADGLGWTRAEPFALWRHPADLPAALARIARPRCPRRIVATMTGEIADCFPSRQVGVERIVDALAFAATAVSPPADLGIYLVDGTLATPAATRARPLLAAASNWHAMARLAAAHAPTARSLGIDVGSTTTDIIMLENGRLAPLALDDVGRMASGELVYTGVERTPVAAIVRSLPWPSVAGHPRRTVAAERFADSRDVWLLLDGIPEDPDCTDTADGAPATRHHARVRLARMLLADPADFSDADAQAAAEWCAEAQARLVARAVARVIATSGAMVTSVVLSGHGECLARRALDRLGWHLPVVLLPERIGPGPARAAPAHALALVARGLIA
ncbi:MAG: hydantoinase/oxoprolinase family protein [Planctomycetia bacterium]